MSIVADPGVPMVDPGQAAVATGGGMTNNIASTNSAAVDNGNTGFGGVDRTAGLGAADGFARNAGAGGASLFTGEATQDTMGGSINLFGVEENNDGSINEDGYASYGNPLGLGGNDSAAAITNLLAHALDTTPMEAAGVINKAVSIAAAFFGAINGFL